MTIIPIPSSVADLIVATTPQESLRNLLENRTIDRLSLLTFGMINTPITRNATGETWAHVVYWEGRTVTVTLLNGEQCDLIGVLYNQAPPDCAQALAIFEEAWSGK